jgi:hypothetical protein
LRALQLAQSTSRLRRQRLATEDERHRMVGRELAGSASQPMAAHVDTTSETDRTATPSPRATTHGATPAKSFT